MGIKIAIFVPSMEGGGVEKVFCNLANSFVKLNYSVEIVLCHKRGIFLSHLDKRINIVDFNETRLKFSFFKYRNYIKNVKPDFIISGPHTTNFIAILSVLTLKTKSKVIATQHNFQDIETLKLGIYGKLIPRLYSFFYPKAFKVVCCSKGVKDYLEALGLTKNNVCTIYNPVITPNFFELANEKIEHKWYSKIRKPFIISVGRLEKVKNYELLIDAFAEFNKAKGYMLLIVGDGSEKTSLQNKIQSKNIEDQVLITGFVSNPYNLINQSVLFVLPSFSEALPTVIIESLALGINVVATNTIGANEVLEGGKYGFLSTNFTNYKKFAELIEFALLNPFHSDYLKRRTVDFESKIIIEKYMGIIENNC